jgi:hypothetical protein
MNKLRRLSCITVIQILIFLGMACYPSFSFSQENEDNQSSFTKAKELVISDYKHFYSLNNLAKVGVGLGVAKVFSGYLWDERFQHYFQTRLRTDTTDNISRIIKPTGNGRYVFPVMVVTALLTEMIKPESVPGGWSKRCLRAYLVGAPPMLFIQRALGSSRPEDGNPLWHPFKTATGVSGHAFISAVPLLTAARMTKNPYLKPVFYISSTFCGLTRINDNAHYFSQVALGWWLAYLSVSCVDETDTHKKSWNIIPFMSRDKAGIMIKVELE